MNRISMLALIMIMVLSISPCWGDVIVPGTREIPLYYQIANINQYPEYVFLIHGVPYPSYEVLNSSEFSTYKLSIFSIYALSRTEFSRKTLEEMNDYQLNEFFQDDARLRRSPLELSGNFRDIPSSSNIERAVMILEIDDVKSQELVITKKQMKYYFKDGSYQLIDFQSQGQIPAPKYHLKIADYLLYIGMPFLALFLVTLILWRRRASKL